MKVTFSVDDEVLQRARRKAENQLIRDYLEQLSGKVDPHKDAAGFERLSRLADQCLGGRSRPSSQ